MSKCLLVLLVALTSLAGPVAVATARDRDHDRLPDRWERRHGLSTAKPSAAGDADRDRLTNRREYRLRTNPRRRDTDRDGLGDRVEVRRFDTNPRRRDTDGDGLSDRAEIRRYHTNPRRRDTDGDGFSDGVEVKAGSDPRNAGSVPASVPAPPRCDVNATPSDLRAVLAAAPAGLAICLASGDYGTFNGADKPGVVTVRAQPGATVQMRVSFSGANNIVLDGVTISSATLSGSTRNVTIRNSAFTGHATIRGLQNANVVFDHNTHLNIDSSGQAESPARIHLSYGGSTHSGVTIQNSLLAGGDSDGVQTGVGVNIINNEFRDILQAGPNHTDAIQLLGAAGSVLRGNYIHDSSTGIVAYDGLNRAVIERNVISLPGRRPWGIELYSDDGSVVRHNTLAYGSCDFNLPCGMIQLSRKSQDDAGQGTIVVDNVATEIAQSSGSGAAERHHNLLRRNARAGDIVGTPAFTGGANPTSWSGFRLANGSPGRGAASDGTDTGI